MSITTAQIRGARGILNWSQQDLAQRTGISATSIGAIENSQTTPRESTLATIRKTLENGGIEFIGTDGVRKRSGDVRVFTGQEGYLDFFNDVYETLNKTPGLVRVSNVDERTFVKWHGEMGSDHLKKMETLKQKKVSYKIMICEGDDFFPASDYAEYRWLPQSQFSTVPFYVYANKLGILIFDNEPKIIMINFPMVAEAYIKQFDTAWENALIPNIKGQMKI
jgi:transcriptional regulator with XRE-family HTH domain